MFLEPHFKGQRSGWIEVISGSSHFWKNRGTDKKTQKSQNC